MLNTRAFADSLPQKAAAVHGWMAVMMDEMTGQITEGDSTARCFALLESFEEGAWFAYDDEDEPFNLDHSIKYCENLEGINFDAALVTYPLKRRYDLVALFSENEGISIHTFLYAVELMARDIPMTFDDHIKIFPKFLWSPMLAIAYRHLHVMPDFNIEAPFIEDTWFLGAYIYYRQVFDGKVIPDFEMIARLEGTVPCKTDEPFFEDAEIDDREAMKRSCVEMILYAAYLHVEPEEKHLELFPRHHKGIKAAARYRVTARRVFTKATCPDCAAIIMSKLPGYTRHHDYAPLQLMVRYAPDLRSSLSDDQLKGSSFNFLFEHIFTSPLKIEPVGPELGMLRMAAKLRPSA